MNNLTTNLKKIIIERFYDKGIEIKIEDFENYMIDINDWDCYNKMINWIVNHWGTLEISSHENKKEYKI